MNTMFQLLLPASLLFATPGGDERPDHAKGNRFAQLDTDGNGSISVAEAEGTRLAKRFAKVDANGDGEISRDEAKAARKGHEHRRGGKMKALDTNGDGMLSVAEVEGTHLAKHFAKVDTDGSGMITKAEMKAARKGKKRGGKGKLKALDANGDGALSAAEVAGTKFEKRFAKLDADGDGSVTRAELKAAHAERKGKSKSKSKGQKDRGQRG